MASIYGCSSGSNSLRAFSERGRRGNRALAFRSIPGLVKRSRQHAALVRPPARTCGSTRGQTPRSASRPLVYTLNHDSERAAGTANNGGAALDGTIASFLSRDRTHVTIVAAETQTTRVLSRARHVQAVDEQRSSRR